MMAKIPTLAEEVPPPCAGDLMIAERKIGVDLSKLDVKYTWNPSWNNVYYGKGLKTTWLHSFWVGVVMSILNLPMIFWRVWLRPVFVVLAASTISLFMGTATRILMGLLGRCAGVKEVDRQQYLDAVNNAIFGNGLMSKLSELMSELRSEKASSEAAKPDEAKTTD